MDTQGAPVSRATEKEKVAPERRCTTPCGRLELQLRERTVLAALQWPVQWSHDQGFIRLTRAEKSVVVPFSHNIRTHPIAQSVHSVMPFVRYGIFVL